MITLDRFVYGSIGAMIIISCLNLAPPKEEEPLSSSSPIAVSEDHQANFDKFASIVESRGIPKNVLAAIANHETGNFKAVIGTANFFGLKCIAPDKDDCIDTKTQEHYNGVAKSEVHGFHTCKNIDFCANVMANTLINLGGLDGKSVAEIRKIFETDTKNILSVIGQKYATDGQWANKVQQHLKQ